MSSFIGLISLCIVSGLVIYGVIRFIQDFVSEESIRPGKKYLVEVLKGDECLGSLISESESGLEGFVPLCHKVDSKIPTKLVVRDPETYKIVEEVSLEITLKSPFYYETDDIL